MFLEEYRRKRLSDCGDLRAAGHTPELGRISGMLSSAFGSQVDYIWCTRCGKREVRWLSRWFGLSARRQCPNAGSGSADSESRNPA
jgi:hypothetical protein